MESVRVPFLPEGEPERFGRDTGPSISVDRRTVVYAADHWIVCRDLRDLALRLAKRFEQKYFTAWSVVANADGSRVAAVIIDTAFIDRQRDFYIGIYEGKDGAEVARLRVNGFQGIALSPDGRVLAVAEKSYNSRNRAVDATIRFYEIPTGREIGAAVHDRVPSGRLQTLASDFHLEFSADGRYLISSGVNTRIWTIG